MQFTIYKKEKIILEIKKRSKRKCKTKSRFFKNKMLRIEIVKCLVKLI